jgi:hypothetical protein
VFVLDVCFYAQDLVMSKDMVARKASETAQ